MSSPSGTTDFPQIPSSLHSRYAAVLSLVICTTTELDFGKSPSLANLILLLAATVVPLRQEVGVLPYAARLRTCLTTHNLVVGSAT